MMVTGVAAGKCDAVRCTVGLDETMKGVPPDGKSRTIKPLPRQS
jgi:cation transport ATPase